MKVVVTGASAGIGEAAVHALVGRGVEVFAGVRRKTDGQRLVRLLGPAVIPLLLDVTKPASVAKAAAVVRKRCGREGLAGLVNNAGVTLVAPVEAMPVAALRQVFEVNVFGVAAVTQALLPLLRQAKGRIVNVSSLSAVVAAPFLAAYCASKSALEAMTDSLRMELAPWGIAVSLVCPGPTATRIWKTSARSAAELEQKTPRQVRALYASAWSQFTAVLTAAENRAAPVASVAAVVVDALTAAAPKTRYLLDDGHALQLRAMPDAERDEVMLRGYGLPGRHG